MRRFASLVTITTLAVSVVCASFVHAATPNMAAVYRFYNLRTGVHFYTASQSEADNVKHSLSSLYRYEGVSFHAYTSSINNASPVHRFYNFKQGVHFYTSNQSEATVVNSTLGDTYRYEGISYYVAASTNQIPVHRF